MKKFVRHIAIILILIISISYVLDICYTYAFDNDHPRNKVQLTANLSNTTIDFIFLGSSRVDNHIDCDLVKELTGKSCLNLGLQGSRINDGKALAELLESNNVTYEKILMQVDYIYNYHNYSPSFIASIVPYVNKKGFPKNLKEDLDLPVSYKIPFARYAYNDKLAGLREVILQYTGKESRVDLKNGFNPLEGVGTKISGEFPNIISTSNNDLDSLVDLSEKVILFTAPYCKNTINRDKFMGDLMGRYPELNNFIDIFDEQEHFYKNCGHLNSQGAREFTKILTKDVLLR